MKNMADFSLFYKSWRILYEILEISSKWRLLIIGAFWKFKKPEVLIKASYFCPKIWILSRDPVPLMSDSKLICSSLQNHNIIWMLYLIVPGGTMSLLLSPRHMPSSPSPFRSIVWPRPTLSTRQYSTHSTTSHFLNNGETLKKIGGNISSLIIVPRRLYFPALQ